MILPASAALSSNSSGPWLLASSSLLSNSSSESDSTNNPSLVSPLSPSPSSSVSLSLNHNMGPSGATSEPPIWLLAGSRQGLSSSMSIAGRWELFLLNDVCFFEQNTAVRLASCVVLMLSCCECFFICLFIVLIFFVWQPQTHHCSAGLLGAGARAIGRWRREGVKFPSWAGSIRVSACGKPISEPFINSQIILAFPCQPSLPLHFLPLPLAPNGTDKQ